MATSLDISGCCPQLWRGSLLREVVLRHPRLDLVPLFADRFVEQASRMRWSAAAASVGSGLRARLAANPLERFSGTPVQETAAD